MDTQRIVLFKGRHEKVTADVTLCYLGRTFLLPACVFTQSDRVVKSACELHIESQQGGYPPVSLRFNMVEFEENERQIDHTLDGDPDCHLILYGCHRRRVVFRLVEYSDYQIVLFSL